MPTTTTTTAPSLEGVLCRLADTAIEVHNDDIRELAWSYACNLALEGEELSTEKALAVIAEFEQDMKERNDDDDED